MSRKFERKLTTIIGAWQIIDGLLTIIAFGAYIKMTGRSDGQLLSGQAVKAVSSIFGSLYTFTVAFGGLLVALGLLNLYFAKTYLKDNQKSYKFPIYLLCLGIVAYFCMDVVTVGLAVIAGIVALSKNKSIKAQRQGKICYSIRLEQDR